MAFPLWQCTSPQLHPCHRLFDQDGHQDSSSPSPRYCSLWPLVISQAQRLSSWGQLRRWKRLWWRSLTRSHRRTSMGPFRSCCNGRNKCIAAGGDYFEGGLEIHVCTINKSAHTKKVWKLIYWSSYIYVYNVVEIPRTF